MKTKVQKQTFQSRAEYLRAVLSKTLTLEQIDPPRLTRKHIASASSTLLELWRIERAAELDAVINTPEVNLDEVAWANFINNRYLSPEQRRVAEEALQRLVAEFPAFVNCTGNQQQLTNHLVEHQQLPNWDTVKGAYLNLVGTGRLFLDPSRVGIMRFGEEGIQGAYTVGQLTADELRKITSPFRPQSEHDAIRAMSADEFYRSEHGRVLREERNRQADQAIFDRQFREAEGAVEFFLAANRDYVRCDHNKRLMLDWIGKHAGGLMTPNTLKQAFNALKDQLELSPENNAEYGATRVIDMSDLGEKNPNHYRPERQHVELVEQKGVGWLTLADIRKWSAEQYAAALKDTDLAPQIEALLSSQ